MGYSVLLSKILAAALVQAARNTVLNHLKIYFLLLCIGPLINLSFDLRFVDAFVTGKWS